MRGKIILITLLMIGYVAANIRAEEIKLRPLDFYHPAVKAAVALQQAREKVDFEVLWAQLSKKTQEILGPDGFRQLHQGTEGKKTDALTSKAKLTGIRVITDNKIWIEASAPDLHSFKGFYFVREDGLWKLAPIERYLKKVSADLDYLSSAINDYYKKNNKLPKDLAELSTDIPADLFSDSNAPYKYKLINNSTCIVYSLGPDSDDDNGLVEYSRKDHPISNGDIIKKVAVQQ